MPVSSAPANKPSRRRFGWKRITALFVVAVLVALAIPLIKSYPDDCTEPGGKVLGVDVPRIRSSRVRMKLADPPSAAARFAPYAVMAALAYASDKNCDNNPNISPAEVTKLRSILAELEPASRPWNRVTAVEIPGGCEDDLGLYYNVWRREFSDVIEVVLAFRGTDRLNDWYYGNLRPLTRIITQDDQYARARRYSDKVISFFQEGPGSSPDGKKIRFVTTGHSLGGGLAQGMLYSRPEIYLQAYAFNSSPVTGFLDQEKDTRRAGCACEASLGAEARVYRFYESLEILVLLRFWQKMLLPPNRNIHEVRFGFSGSPNLFSQHSGVAIADMLADEAKKKSRTGSSDKPWYDGIGAGCTEQFARLQQQSCAIPADGFWTCPE